MRQIDSGMGYAPAWAAYGRFANRPRPRANGVSANRRQFFIPQRHKNRLILPNFFTFILLTFNGMNRLSGAAVYSFSTI
jgi:hypothetical protein